MEPPIEIRFQVTREEFVQATRRAVLQHPFVRLLAFALVVSIGFLCAFPPWGTLGPGAVVAMMLAAFGGIYLFYAVLIFPNSSFDRLHREIRESPVQYCFTTTGIDFKGATFQGRSDWSNYRYFSEAKDSFSIYPKSTGNYILVPKRVFKSDESTNALRELLKARLRVW